MNSDKSIFKRDDTSLTIFPGGTQDTAAFAAPNVREEGGMTVFNGSIVPPLDSDYLQFTPNNRLLSFLNISLSEQDKQKLSYENARRRAQRLYTESVETDNLASKDHSLAIVNSVIDDYSGNISSQEFAELQIGLSEITSEQLLKLVDESARQIKVSANDRLQIFTTVFCVVTTAITVATLFAGAGTTTAPTAAAKKAGTSALRKFLNHVTGKMAAFYAGTLGKLLLVSEVAGDVLVTSQEVINVWDELSDPSVRANRDMWSVVSRLMQTPAKPNKIVYRYIMKPVEMIALLAIWERGDRSALDSRLRNLIYGKPAYFATDMKTFGKIKYRIGRIGRDVEKQLGTPSLFPAFSLVLRIMARLAAQKGVPVVGPFLSGSMWLFRFKQLDDRQKGY
jgi:hypothetical protein